MTKFHYITCLSSVSVSPKGWTDQELGLKWLEQDFEPNTRSTTSSTSLLPTAPQAYRLLILDGHNSHCTYPFIKFAADHRIIIICLPSHTTHALQPCDVGIFGPLARAWKSQVTEASQNNIPITKANLLLYYHKARSIALKSTTIQSAFRKTGIYPFDRNAIPLSAYEPAKNTTTKAAQPLPAQLPSILVPTPSPSPAVSAGTITPGTTPAVSAAPSTLALDISIPTDAGGTDPIANECAVAQPDSDLVQRYHVWVPPPLPHTASRRALREENMTLRGIIERVGLVLEHDYAQMKLMDLENERLRQKAFAKEQKKAAKQKLASGQARHMTAPEMMDLLARQTWEATMKDLFKEASEKFKVQRKGIDDYHKGLAAEKKAKEKARKAAEREAKKAEAEAEKARAQAERVATHGRGRSRSRGQGRGRGRGRVEMTVPHVSDTDDSEEQDSDLNPALTDNDDLPMAETAIEGRENRPQRACRARAPRFLPSDDEEAVLVLQVDNPRPRPRPIPVWWKAPLVPSAAPDTNTQLADGATTNAPQSECREVHVVEETVGIGSGGDGLSLIYYHHLTVLFPRYKKQENGS
jgi:DDE superfamily endonuclease